MLSVLLNWLKLVYGTCTILIPMPYEPKWQVATSLLSYYIPTYIVMMELIIKKQFTVVFELLTKKKEEQIVECKNFLMSHTFPFTPQYICILFWPKSSFLSTSSISLLLAFYRSCTISDASFADSSASICQIRTWMLWKLSGTRLFRVGWQLET